MQRRHAVDAVGTDDRKIRHMHLAVPENGGIPQTILPIRPAAVKGRAVPAVNFLDDLIDPGQQGAHQLDGPLLQGFGHNGVVGI